MKHDNSSPGHPSQWQEKYGRNGVPARQERVPDDQSLEEWIASIEKKAENEVRPFVSPFETLVAPESMQADNDAEAVIAQMKKLLSEAPSASRGHDNMDSDLSLDFGREFSEYFNTPDIDEIPARGRSPREGFSGENMAVLFGRTRDETIVRRCFEGWKSLDQQRKSVLRRVFHGWNGIARSSRESEDHLVKRIRRRFRDRRQRRILRVWSAVTREKSVLAQRLTERRMWKTKSRVFALWNRLARRERSRRAQEKDKIERVKLARRMKRAHHFHRAQVERAFFVAWRVAAKKAQADVPKRTAIVEEATPNKTANKELRQAEDIETSPIVTATATCITPERIPSAAINNDEPVNKENQKPNQNGGSVRQRKATATKPNLLRPVKPQRPKPTAPRSSLRDPGATPKLIVDMNKRKQEREQRREELRRRYEQKAAETKRRSEAERRRKEEDETREQRRFFERKAEEERQKKMAAARWKQACRLAMLHYRMSLQQRLFRRWKKIFHRRDFNERKARLAWTDALYEKCWHRWKVFKDKEMLKRERLAGGYDKRRVLAKAFASFEAHHHCARSLLNEAERRASARRLLLAFRTWRCTAVNATKERSVLEKMASVNGKRLLLRRAIQCWKCGARISRDERELARLMEAKWEQVNKWLEDR